MNFQSLLQHSFQSAFHLTETIAPALAQRWAIRLFFRPMKFTRPPREAKLLATATIARHAYASFYPLPAADCHVLTYEWGRGPTVLLVHGWAGRGSQMATMAAPLVAAGYRVLTFDAPAHGDSPGKRTNLPEVAHIIKELSAQQEGFAAIIGHSFGGMAAGFALAEGAQAAKLVTIGSPVTMATVLDGFRSQLNAKAKTIAGVQRVIERLANRPVADFSLSHNLADSPVPGLIVHDRQDRDVSYQQALLLHEVWPNSILRLTDGLGHRRILRDPATIAQIVAFIAEGERNGMRPELLAMSH